MPCAGSSFADPSDQRLTFRGICGQQYQDSSRSTIAKEVWLECKHSKELYRPVRNLSFASKFAERIVSARLSEHMDTHELHEQSAYKPHHGVESALIRVHCDIQQAMDRQRIVVLVLLDLSAAFNTIDHRVLLHRLSHDLGVAGTALRWFQSYLEDRKQSVTIQNALPAPRDLRFVCPMAQCWGPRCSLSTQLLSARSQKPTALNTISTPMTPRCTSRSIHLA